MREADYLDATAPAAQDDRAPWFKWMTDNWPDRATAELVLDMVHRKDVDRAAQPVVVNVTVPGVPGHFTGTLGSEGVAYSPDTLT
jgi:hypothetical protein